jgi:hypothetical protein
VLVLGGVSFGAYSYLSGGGDQPSNALPSSAVGYVRVDLDPSAGQKVDMLRLLRSVPDFEESTGISSDKADLRRLLIEEMLPSTGCDLTYEDDFEPWVGDRAGFAGVPVGDTVAPVISIQVKDEAAAGDTADALEQCAIEESGDEDATGYDFVGDYMIVTEEQHLADVVDQTEESSLADNDTFTSDMDELGEQGVLSYWLDVDALRELPAAAQSLDESGAAELSEGLHSSYGALRAGDNYIELLLSARADEELSDARTPVAELPESTMVAASFSGGGEAVNSYWNSFLESMDATTGGYAEDELDSLEQGTGLRFPDDLVTLLGENLTFTMSPDGLDQETLESGDLTRLNFGARFVTDAERLQSILTSVEQLAADAGSPIDLITQETDDGLVIASNEEYAGQIAEGGSLGDSDTFQTAVPNAEDTLGVLYVDLNKLRDVAEQFGEDPDVAEAMRYLEPFEAAGFSVVQNDGTVDSVLRLTFD